MKYSSWKQYLTLSLTLVVIAVNVMANILPLNGQGTGEISDRFEINFVPAGYVFSIWGVIYLGLLFFSIFQVFPAQKNNSLLNTIAPWYWVSSLANIAWIFLWHYELFFYALGAMLIILISLILIYILISKSRGKQKWLMKIPFSIYLGWISVATIANVSQILFILKWGGFGMSGIFWTVVMITAAVLLGLIVAWRESDILYSLVIIWALIGISVSQLDAMVILAAAWTGVIVLIIGFLVSSISNKKIY